MKTLYIKPAQTCHDAKQAFPGESHELLASPWAQDLIRGFQRLGLEGLEET